jgi:hypothetical protein
LRNWADFRQPLVRRAVELTGGRAEFKNRHAPTWDGRSWHFARVRSEMHVVHEVAHWLAQPKCRDLPNYGLGKDPDGGPSTGYGMIERTWDRKALREIFDDLPNDADRIAFLKRQNDWEEEIATVLSVFLMRMCGFSGWLGEAKRTHLLEPGNEWKALLIAELLAERGVDLYDPIPGLLEKAVARAV